MARIGRRRERKLVALATLAGAVLVGCGSATGPEWEPPAGTLVLWGVVVDESGTCVTDATVTIIGGERHGEVIRQVTPCSVNEDLGRGFFIGKLSLGQRLTVRGSAPGYQSRDVNVLVSFPPDGLLEIRLLKSDT